MAMGAQDASVDGVRELLEASAIPTDAYASLLAKLGSTDALGASLAQGDEPLDCVWRACVGWLLRALGSKPARLPLSQLVHAAESNLPAVFREMPVVLAKLRTDLEAKKWGDKDVERALRLKEWQETLVLLTILSKKYKDLTHRFLRVCAPQQSATQAGWLLFLVIKAQLLPGFPDLVSCLQLLVCTLNLLLSSQLLTEEQVVLLCQEHPGAVDASGRLSTLKALADALKMDAAAAKALMPRVEAAFGQLMDSSAAPSGVLRVPVERHPQAARMQTGCAECWPELLAARPKMRAQELVLALDARYQQLYEQHGEIDERELLTTDFALLASPRVPLMVAPALPPPAPGPSLATKPPLAPSGVGGGVGTTSVPAPTASRRLMLGLQSPLPLMHLGPPGPATPITTAMSAVAWLRTATKDATVEPSPTLNARFVAAGSDVAAAVVKCVREAAAAVFSVGSSGSVHAAPFPGLHGLPQLHESYAMERRNEALKLYWRMLEAMLRLEERTSGSAGVKALVMSRAFHQCLLACTFELVVASYRMLSLSFPAVLERLALQPFDMVKMVSLCVRAEPGLPKELKRHLFTIEEKVLESLAWQPGSSLYRLMRAAAPVDAADGDEDMVGSEDVAGGRGAPAASQPQSTALASSSLAPGDEAAAMDTDAPGCGAAGARRGSDGGEARPSPARGDDEVPPNKRQRSASGEPTNGRHDHRPQPQEAALPYALGPPLATDAGGGGDPAAAAVLHDFCRKVLKLAAFRLVAVSECLDFSPMSKADVLTATFEVLSHALYHQTHLFYGRHLDQVALSALYGYSKVNKLHQISFREIISQYRRQPHARQEVFRIVALERTLPGLVTQSTGDVIAFYNQIFVPAMKSHLLDAVVPAGAAAAAAPPPPCAAAVQALSAATAQGLLNRSPIFTALQAAQAAGQGVMAPGQLIVKRAVGAGGRSPLQQMGGAGGGVGASGGAGAGAAYRTLSLDAGVGLPACSSQAGSPTPDEPPQLASPPHGRGGKPAPPPPHPMSRSYVPSRLGQKAPSLGGLVVVNTSPRGMRALQPRTQPDVTAEADQGGDLLPLGPMGLPSNGHAPPPPPPAPPAPRASSAGLRSPTGRRSPLTSTSPRGSRRGSGGGGGGSRSGGGAPASPPPGVRPGSGTPSGLATLLQALDTAGELGTAAHDVHVLGRREQAIMQE